MKRSPALAASTLCAIALTLTACGDSSSSSSSAPTGPIMPTATDVADPVLTPPQQHNPAGLKDVRFDPCTGIDDATLSKAGIDPTTRKRGSDVTDATAGYTVLSCAFTAKADSLLVNSSNLVFADYKTKYGKDTMAPANIAGHDSAVQFVDQAACVVAMQSTDGVFEVQATPTAHTADPCTSVQPLATALATTLH